MHTPEIWAAFGQDIHTGCVILSIRKMPQESFIKFYEVDQVMCSDERGECKLVKRVDDPGERGIETFGNRQIDRGLA